MPTTAQEATSPLDTSRLDGAQIAALREVLLAAFTKALQFDQLTRVRLGTPLAEIVSEDANLRDVAYTLILWAASQGRLRDLVVGALDERPAHAPLRALATAWGVPAPQTQALQQTTSLPPPATDGAIDPPGGPYNPQWYVARPEPEEWIESHLRTGVPVVLQAPRYMGRSWLMARALERLRATTPDAVLYEINLGRVDHTNFEKLARQLAGKFVPRSPEMKARIEEIWSDDMATVEDRLSQVVEELVLVDRKAPIAFVYDVPDAFLQGPCWGPFIQLHRTWMQELSPRWRTLRLVFSWSSHPRALGFDTTSQLNREVLKVGDMTPDEVAALAGLHGVAWDMASAARVATLCGGHPFLVRQCLHALAEGESLDALEARALVDGGVFRSPVLDDAAGLLRDNPAMLAAVRAVVDGAGGGLDVKVARALESVGVLAHDGARWRLRYGLYAALPRLALAP
jgi:hypothetical protein